MSIPAPLPQAEDERLAALYEYGLLDTPSEEQFDAFTRLAATVCEVPMAVISLIDRDRQWFKSLHGITVQQTTRDEAFCAHTILEDAILEVSDATRDPRFAGNPLVLGDPGIRFYAGVPLRTPAGDAVGALCVFDRVPRSLTAMQRSALEGIAAAIVAQFEARRTMLHMFDSSRSELYQVDLRAGRLLFASAAARRNLGYTIEELRTLPLRVLLPTLAREGRLAERVASLRASPTPRLTLRTSAQRKNGTRYPIELRIEPIPGRTRDIVVALATDLTQSEHDKARINLLSTAIESVLDPICIAQPGSEAHDSPTIVYANAAFERQKRVPIADLIGRRVDTFYGPKTDRSRLDFMNDEMVAGRAVRIEYVAYRGDGSSYDAEATARPLVDESGRTTNFVVVQRDVTEQVQRRAHLAMQNERLTAVASIARTFFTSLEPTLLVDALQRGVRDLVGGTATLYAPHAGGFAATSDLSVNDEAALGDAFIAHAAGSASVVFDEGELRAAERVPASGGGTAFVLEVRRLSPFGGADVFALGLLVQYFALAARNVELYGELASRRDAVVELNQVKNDLIAMLAHDFRGPLTTIVGFADVLAEDDGFDAEARQYLGMISSSAMRLAALAADTLALSRLEQNELALTVTQVDLIGLVREVARVYSVTRPIDVRVSAAFLTVTGDESRLRQVLENLIGNAIKYSPGGEPVEIVMRGRPGGVEIVVRDRGIGIPAVERAKLFGRFARASNARALGIAGTGFGLYLSKTIVELHGGTIDVESVEGSGAAFRVLLPTQATHRTAGSRRVVLLDADGDGRSYVAHALREDGFWVVVAGSGEALLRLLQDVRFDAALVDADALEMPPDAFVTRARGDAALICMSVRRPERADGWSAFVAKPFLMKDLHNAVNEALDREPAHEAAASH